MTTETQRILELVADAAEEIASLEAVRNPADYAFHRFSTVLHRIAREAARSAGGDPLCLFPCSLCGSRTHNGFACGLYKPTAPAPAATMAQVEKCTCPPYVCMQQIGRHCIKMGMTIFETPGPAQPGRERIEESVTVTKSEQMAGDDRSDTPKSGVEHMALNDAPSPSSPVPPPTPPDAAQGKAPMKTEADYLAQFDRSPYRNRHFPEDVPRQQAPTTTGENGLREWTPDIDALVHRFLMWPLPESVQSDVCATERGYRHRSGTNLLGADEARQMIEYLLTDTRSPLRAETPGVTTVGEAVPMEQAIAAIGNAASANPKAPVNLDYQQCRFIAFVLEPWLRLQSTGGAK